MRELCHSGRANVFVLAFMSICQAGLCPALSAQEPLKSDKPPLAKQLESMLRAVVEDIPGLPRVLLIGDSISMGYAQPVRELLKGKANIHRPSENCGPTEHGLKQLDEWLGDGKWDLIHFNFGLHDLKYLDDKGRYVGPENGKQVAPLPDYEHNLRELVTRLKKTGAKLVWCATTPVPEGSQGRVKGAEVEYNLVAEKIMKENGVAINDLHALAQEHQDQIQLPRNVHFTEDGYKKLAEQVVASIQAQLGK